MSGVISQKTTTRNLSRNRLVRDTQRELAETVFKFRKACAQLSLIDRRLKDMNRRFEAAKRDGNQCFKYNLRIKMSALESVRSIYYEYVYMRAEDVSMLRHDVRFLMRQKHVESDEEYESEED